MPPYPPPALLALVLAALLLAVALNLFLTLRLAARIREAEEAAAPLLLPPGQSLPPFQGRRRADGTIVSASGLAGGATVLVFLSSGCPACRAAVPELTGLLPAADRAGVALWIVPADSVHGLPDLLERTPLAERVLDLDDEARRGLNPRRAAPAYLFVDDRLVVQAGGQLGDPDWLSFVEQMREQPVEAG